jgi:integrase/recombinase XerD
MPYFYLPEKRSDKGKRKRRSTAKTDAGERTILLPETAEKTLRAIRAINPFGEFLFMDKQGRRIRANRFNHWLHKACIKVGIPERSTHKIRKTYASILLSNQVDDRLVTLQMGHTDIATTRGSYYFNRKSEAQNKKVISSVINF